MGLRRSNSLSCKQPHTVVSKITTVVIIIQCVYTELFLDWQRWHTSHQCQNSEGKKGGLAELKIVISYPFFFCFACWNPTATFQKEPQTKVTYTHVCHDCLNPSLTGEMTAAGMFDLVDSYLLVLFYLGFACVGFLHFVWEMFIIWIIISANQTYSQLLRKTFCF